MSEEKKHRLLGQLLILRRKLRLARGGKPYRAYRRI